MNPEQALPACAGGPCEAQVPSRPCRRAHKASGGNSKRFGAALGARHSFNGISRSCPHCKHRRHSPSPGARSVNSRQPSCLPRSRCLRRPPGSKKRGRKTFFFGGTQSRMAPKLLPARQRPRQSWGWSRGVTQTEPQCGSHNELSVLRKEPPVRQGGGRNGEGEDRAPWYRGLDLPPVLLAALGAIWRHTGLGCSPLPAPRVFPE